VRFPKWIAALALVTATSVAMANEPAGTAPTADKSPTATTPASTPEAPMAQAQPQQALDLPKAADQLRDKGVPEGEVKKALDAARDEKLSAAEAGMLFDDLAKMNLPSDREQIERFGDVVEDQLEKGLRGASLVQAVQTDLSTPKELQEKDANPLNPDGNEQDTMKRDERNPNAPTTPGANPTPPARNP
jgi:hypothetical protein